MIATRVVASSFEPHAGFTVAGVVELLAVPGAELLVAASAGMPTTAFDLSDILGVAVTVAVAVVLGTTAARGATITIGVTVSGFVANASFESSFATEEDALVASTSEVVAPAGLIGAGASTGFSTASSLAFGASVAISRSIFDGASSIVGSTAPTAALISLVDGRSAMVDCESRQSTKRECSTCRAEATGA